MICHWGAFSDPLDNVWIVPKDDVIEHTHKVCLCDITWHAVWAPSEGTVRMWIHLHTPMDGRPVPPLAELLTMVG